MATIRTTHVPDGEVRDPFGFLLETPEEIEEHSRWLDTLDQERQADIHTPERAAHDDKAEREWDWQQLMEAIDNEPEAPEAPEWMEEVG